MKIFLAAFGGGAVVRYYLPASTQTAQIAVVDINGQTVKAVSLSAIKGQGQVTINAGELAAGNYFYTLYVNGVKADTKQMVVAK